MVRKIFRSPKQMRDVQQQFLALLSEHGLTARAAAAKLDINIQTFNTWRKAQPRFKAAWRRAMVAGDRLWLQQVLARPLHVGKLPFRGRRTADLPEARQCHLCILRDGGRVWYAARRIGVSDSTIEDWRQLDPVFAAEWRSAYQAGSVVVLDDAARRAARESSR